MPDVNSVWRCLQRLECDLLSEDDGHPATAVEGRGPGPSLDPLIVCRNVKERSEARKLTGESFSSSRVHGRPGSVHRIRGSGAPRWEVPAVIFASPILEITGRGSGPLVFDLTDYELEVGAMFLQEGR